MCFHEHHTRLRRAEAVRQFDIINFQPSGYALNTREHVNLCLHNIGPRRAAATVLLWAAVDAVGGCAECVNICWSEHHKPHIYTIHIPSTYSRLCVSSTRRKFLNYHTLASFSCVLWPPNAHLNAERIHRHIYDIQCVQVDRRHICMRYDNADCFGWKHRQRGTAYWVKYIRKNCYQFV